MLTAYYVDEPEEHGFAVWAEDAEGRTVLGNSAESTSPDWALADAGIKRTGPWERTEVNGGDVVFVAPCDKVTG